MSTYCIQCGLPLAAGESAAALPCGSVAHAANWDRSLLTCVDYHRQSCTCCDSHHKRAQRPLETPGEQMEVDRPPCSKPR